MFPDGVLAAAGRNAIPVTIPRLLNSAPQACVRGITKNPCTRPYSKPVSRIRHGSANPAKDGVLSFMVVYGAPAEMPGLFLASPASLPAPGRFLSNKIPANFSIRPSSAFCEQLYPSHASFRPRCVPLAPDSSVAAPPNRACYYSSPRLALGRNRRTSLSQKPTCDGYT